jgi:thioredoxin reductase
MRSTVECVVVGGGAAGLSAALVLGRARRETFVVDNGRQSNLPADGIGGLLGHNGRAPAEFYELARAEVAVHPSVTLRVGEVVQGRCTASGFELDLADGESLLSERVLLATGMRYRYAQLPGIAERWGQSVFHCPFCHGWEVRDRPLAVIGDGAGGVHRALLLRAWSEDVTLLTNGSHDIEDEARRRLQDANVAIDERAIAELRGDAPSLSSIAFTDGSERACGGLLVPVTLHQRSALAAALGASLAEPGVVTVDAIEVDDAQKTTVPGLWAAGDASTQMPTITGAFASGSKAAAMIVGDLTSG